MRFSDDAAGEDEDRVMEASRCRSRSEVSVWVEREVRRANEVGLVRALGADEEGTGVGDDII
jgi:hypothetical protein